MKKPTPPEIVVLREGTNPIQKSHKNMIETKKRSLVKSIVWRILGIIIMPPIIYYSSKMSSGIAETALFSTMIFHSTCAFFFPARP